MIGYLNQFFRDVRAQKLRLGLTLFGIVWGTVAVALLLAFGDGFRAHVTKSMKGLGENIVICWPSRTSKPYAGLPRGRQLRVTEEDIDRLAAEVPEISAVSAEYSTGGLTFKAGRKTVTPTLVGVNPTFAAMRNIIPEEGSRFVNALDADRRRRCVFLGDGILVFWPGRTGLAFEGFPPGRRTHFLPEDTDLLVGRIPEIASISGEMVRWGTQLSAGRKVLNKKMIGVEPEYGPMRAHFPEPGGRFINDLDQRLKRRVIFLGFKLKKDLFDDEDPVGRQLFVNNAPFTVIGVMREKKQMGMYGGPDEDHAVIPLSTFQALLGDPYLDDMVVRPVDPTFSLSIGLATVAILGAIGMMAGYFPSRRAAMVQPAVALRHE